MASRWELCGTHRTAWMRRPRSNRASNELTIKVTNAWVNRLIGDQQPDATTKYTFADVKPYKANSPLLPSGLLGPVTIVEEKRLASALTLEGESAVPVR